MNNIKAFNITLMVFNVICAIVLFFFLLLTFNFYNEIRDGTQCIRFKDGNVQWCRVCYANK